MICLFAIVHTEIAECYICHAAKNQADSSPLALQTSYRLLRMRVRTQRFIPALLSSMQLNTSDTRPDPTRHSMIGQKIIALISLLTRIYLIEDLSTCSPSLQGSYDTLPQMMHLFLDPVMILISYPNLKTFLELPTLRALSGSRNAST